MKINFHADNERKMIVILFWDSDSKQTKEFIEKLNNEVRDLAEVNVWCMYDDSLNRVDIFGCWFASPDTTENHNRIWKSFVDKVRVACNPCSDDSSSYSDYELYNMPTHVRYDIENR